MKVETKTMNARGATLTADESSKAELFETIIELYNEPRYAAIREITVNGVEAQYGTPNEGEPVVISIDNGGDYISVQIADKGKGMDSNDIENRMARGRASDKRGSNEFTGGFGIGFLSLFGVAKNFYVISTKEGKTSMAVFNAGASGQAPSVEFTMRDKYTGKPSGTTIAFVNEGSSLREFIWAVRQTAYALPPGAVDARMGDIHLDDVASSYDEWKIGDFIRPKKNNAANLLNSYYNVRQGGVIYSMPQSLWDAVMPEPGYSVRNYWERNWIVDAEIGDFTFPRSREVVHDSPENRAALARKFSESQKVLKEKCEDLDSQHPDSKGLALLKARNLFKDMPDFFWNKAQEWGIDWVSEGFINGSKKGQKSIFSDEDGNTMLVRDRSGLKSWETDVPTKLNTVRFLNKRPLVILCEQGDLKDTGNIPRFLQYLQDTKFKRVVFVEKGFKAGVFSFTENDLDETIGIVNFDDLKETVAKATSTGVKKTAPKKKKPTGEINGYKLFTTGERKGQEITDKKTLEGLDIPILFVKDSKVFRENYTTFLDKGFAILVAKKEKSDKVIKKDLEGIVTPHEDFKDALLKVLENDSEVREWYEHKSVAARVDEWSWMPRYSDPDDVEVTLAEAVPTNPAFATYMRQLYDGGVVSSSRYGRGGPAEEQFAWAHLPKGDPFNSGDNIATAKEGVLAAMREAFDKFEFKDEILRLDKVKDLPINNWGDKAELVGRMVRWELQYQELGEQPSFLF